VPTFLLESWALLLVVGGELSIDNELPSKEEGVL
jgi:hypothetical protein